MEKTQSNFRPSRVGRMDGYFRVQGKIVLYARFPARNRAAGLFVYSCSRPCWHQRCKEFVGYRLPGNELGHAERWSISVLRPVRNWLRMR